MPSALLQHSQLQNSLDQAASPLQSVRLMSLCHALLQLIALHDVTSTDAAIVYTLEPVLGATLAYLLLGERWGPAGWVGAGLIVASSLTTQIFGQPDIPPPDAHSD